MVESSKRQLRLRRPDTNTDDKTSQTSHDQNSIGSAADADESKPLHPSSILSSKPITFRFCIVWTARILLPIVFILSNAKFVTIPPSSSPATTRSDFENSQIPVGLSSAILIITHSRDIYLARCLDSLLKYHPQGGPSNWPIIISRDEQDGAHPSLDGVILHAKKTASERGISIEEWHHNVTSYQKLEKSEEEKKYNMDFRFINLEAYARISRHYKWALTNIFSSLYNFERVVIIEDDMSISKDFYNYFEALTPVLHHDKSLYCISSWNDNGVPELSDNVNRLYRTDFFPGLGWMLIKELWMNELQSKWPNLFWDDWLRSSEQRKNRQCIRPEVSRTLNFGRIGVSQSFHFDNYISKITNNNFHFTDFHSLNLSYLYNDNYFHMFFTQFSNATRLKFSNYLTTRPITSDVIAFYPKDRMEQIGKRTGIMTDHREGITRTSYYGVISIPWRGYTAYLVEKGWQPPEGYQLGARECC